MSDLQSQLSQLSPEHRQAILVQAQQQANQAVMQGTYTRSCAPGQLEATSKLPFQSDLMLFMLLCITEMMKKMVAACFDKCAGTSVSAS